MGKFEPTVEQIQAIDTKSGVLVSAAAGSGKTAVLVERVIKLLTSDNPIPADRLLIVTFTNAAAEEMRLRIEKRLNEECQKNAKNNQLLRQKLRLRNAKICTIDSFCIDLVRENFDRMSISPDFSIGNEETVISLFEDAFSSVANLKFESNDLEFLKLLDAFCPEYDETNLKNAVYKLYSFAQNMPFPNAWLENIRDELFLEDAYIKISNEVLFCVLKKIKTQKSRLSRCLASLDAYPEVKEKYLPAFSDTRELLCKIEKKCENENWDSVFKCCSDFKLARLAAVKGYSDDPVISAVKETRKSVKSEIEKILKLVYAPAKTVKSDFSVSADLTRALINLTLEFSEIFHSLKNKKGIYTFSDIEHFALNILCKNQNGKIIANDSAKDIIAKYEEILVDEFQDTNNLQDILFSVLSQNERKLFVVGDVKQSIYRFRGANPDNFLKKKKTYIPYSDASDGELKKIILGNNFRSRKEVCDFVNFFFSIFMDGSDGGVVYNDEEKLIPNAKFPDNENAYTEIHLIDVTDGYSASECEAEHTANYISDFMKNGKITDKSGAFRKPRYDDFAILLRSMSSNAAKYSEILLKHNIPVSYNQGEFFKSAEIQTIISLLSVVANPTRDIPLVSVMMSPLFSFSADEMAKIRTVNNSHIISAVSQSAQNGDEHSKEFLKVLNILTDVSVLSGVSELLDYIYDSTDFLNICSAYSGGETRRKNLLKLSELASEYENNYTDISVGGFLKYLKNLEDTGYFTSYPTDSQNAVRIMSIHASKGLQFPVCIFANSAAKFNNSDYTERMLISEKSGVSFKYFDENTSAFKTNILREFMAEKAREDQVSEELRLAYVAFTRAEEKLILVSSFKKLDEKLEYAAVNALECDTLEEYRKGITSATSYSDWILAAAVVHQSGNELRKNMPSAGFIYPSESFVKIEKISVTVSEKNFSAENPLINSDEKIKQTVEKHLQYTYPFEDLRTVESKSSVAILAHSADIADYSFTDKPAFMMKSGMTPAERGTATHRFMQFCDFDKAKINPELEAERLYEYEFITLAEKEAIDFKAVANFFESDLYQRIINSKSYKREMRFLTEMPAGTLNEGLPESVKNTLIIVQGSVDLAFEEEDGVVVLDFKTDRATNPQILIETYSPQLKIYGAACEKIYEKPLKELLIYSFNLSKTIIL